MRQSPNAISRSVRKDAIDHKFDRESSSRMSLPEGHWQLVYDSAPRPLPWQLTEIPLEVDQWVARVPIGSPVLDLGCGTGEIAGDLGRRGYKVTGVDFSAAAIEEAERTQHAPNLRFVQCSLLDYSPTLPHELTILYSVLHHINPEAWQELSDHLAYIVPDGSLLGLCTYALDPADPGLTMTRVGRMGNKMTHTTLPHLRSIFEPEFALLEASYCMIGRQANHLAISALFRRGITHG